jgi:hypothetical protein
MNGIRARGLYIGKGDDVISVEGSMAIRFKKLEGEI